MTHKEHHQFTGNIDKDEVYYPQREEPYIVRGWPPIVPYFFLGLRCRNTVYVYYTIKPFKDTHI